MSLLRTTLPYVWEQILFQPQHDRKVQVTLLVVVLLNVVILALLAYLLLGHN